MSLRSWENELKTKIIHSIKEKYEVAHIENNKYCKMLMRTEHQRAGKEMRGVNNVVLL